MKNSINIITIILFSITTSLSSQPNNQMPDTWHPDLSNSYIRKAINITTHNNTRPPKTNKGRLYNTISTKYKTNTPTSTPFQNNNNYYHSYGIDHNTTQNITHNTPTQIKSTTFHDFKNTQTNEIITTKNRKNALDRDNKPNDPSIVPIDNPLIPMLIFALIWIILKSKTNKSITKA